MRLAKFSITLSILCAIHCVALPIFAALSAAAGLVGHGPVWLEALSLIPAAVLGYLGLGLSARVHRNFAPLAVLTLGLGLLISGHLVEAPLFAVPASLLGASAIILAQALDRRLRPTCHTPAGGIHTSGRGRDQAHARRSCFRSLKR
jgi:hypothetical protein